MGVLKADVAIGCDKAEVFFVAVYGCPQYECFYVVIHQKLWHESSK